MKKFSTLIKNILIISLILFLDSTFAQQASLWDQVPQEIRIRNSFKRIEWFYRQRAVPFDTIPRQVYLTELNKEIVKSKEQEDNLLYDLQWSPIGPSGIISGFPSHWGEVSGRIRGLAVHPADPNTVYIGAASGGIWKTIDGGISWTNIGDNLATSTYGSIAIDPGNPNTVYAGAGEIMYNFSPFIYEGQGLFKSTDGGNVWNQVTTGFGNVTHFGDLEVSPHNSNYVFAALGSG